MSTSRGQIPLMSKLPLDAMGWDYGYNGHFTKVACGELAVARAGLFSYITG